MLFTSKNDKVVPVSDTDRLKQQLKERTEQELAVADVTELINNMTRNCFDLCFETPGESVTPAQKRCTDMCLQKYMASWDILSKVYVSRIQESS